MSWFERYGKTIALVVGVVAMPITTALTDNVIANDEKIMIAIALANAVMVYFVPNLTGGTAHVAKGIVSAALAVLTGLTGALVGGMTAGDWWALLVAGAVAAGVIVLPAQQHQTAGVVPPPSTVPGTGSVG